MLTDEDIKRIGNEIVKRMTGVANIKKRRNRYNRVWWYEAM